MKRFWKTQKSKLLRFIPVNILFILSIVTGIGCDAEEPIQSDHIFNTPDTYITDSHTISTDEHPVIGGDLEGTYSVDETDYHPLLEVSAGRWAIYIASEDIVAYYDLLFNNSAYEPEFGLVPLSEDERLPAWSRFSPRANTRSYDWHDYQHRLSEAEYHFYINSALESEIFVITHRNLYVDGVVRVDSEMDILPLPRIQWVNDEVLESFVQDNVTVNFVDDFSQGERSASVFIDALTSNLTWQVYRGGCFKDFRSYNDVCYQHAFDIWLVDFSNSYRVIWDMKSIVEPGCGRDLHLS